MRTESHCLFSDLRVCSPCSAVCPRTPPDGATSATAHALIRSLRACVHSLLLASPKPASSASYSSSSSSSSSSFSSPPSSSVRSFPFLASPHACEPTRHPQWRMWQLECGWCTYHLGVPERNGPRYWVMEPGWMRLTGREQLPLSPHAASSPALAEASATASPVQQASQVLVQRMLLEVAYNAHVDSSNKDKSDTTACFSSADAFSDTAAGSVSGIDDSTSTCGAGPAANIPGTRAVQHWTHESDSNLLLSHPEERDFPSPPAAIMVHCRIKGIRTCLGGAFTHGRTTSA